MKKKNELILLSNVYQPSWASKQFNGINEEILGRDFLILHKFFFFLAYVEPVKRLKGVSLAQKKNQTWTAVNNWRNRFLRVCLLLMRIMHDGGGMWTVETHQSISGVGSRFGVKKKVAKHRTELSKAIGDVNTCYRRLQLKWSQPQREFPLHYVAKWKPKHKRGKKHQQ